MTATPPFDQIRTAALAALRPIEPAPPNAYFYGERTRAGIKLPPHYLVYFVLVELLRFPAFGRSEKVSWSVPVQLGQSTFVIEHRKMGLGIFAQPGAIDETVAAKVVGLVKAAVAAASPYFDWLAAEAVNSSKLNVANKAPSLFARFEYIREQHRRLEKRAARVKEPVVEERTTPHGSSTTLRFPSFELRRQADWVALAAIDAFFSWTEHVFIHLAILQGRITTGTAVAKLAAADWAEKFKNALNIQDAPTKRLFDDLMLIRQQLRNYMAHGAFGKRGEAFSFHSAAGAVPVLLPHRARGKRFTLSGAPEFTNPSALEVVDRFIKHLWSDGREPARAYIQDSSLPIILTFAADGQYPAAMQSMEEMVSLIEALEYQFDQAANMEW